ncbi:hypothetical protein OSB04_013088 [Centaurea solstitialis]|uniref:Disease resistance RPP13-like protein 1 n=1 Tax=Centaurea solstitialis TaxID=347529 RepID=A0AA38TEC2_9ASTR|nr:hypothetical protein OSB04_013088 [Centaurea solstitialis]
MAEIIVGAIATVLFEKLASADFMNMVGSEGLDVQLNKWKKNFSHIQQVLADAGQKQITDRSVESWLRDLQDLAYDIDDVLDDLATEAMRRKLNKEADASSSSNSSTSTSKALLKFIPTCCTNSTPRKIMYGHKMSSRLDEISTKLHELAELKNTLGLAMNVNVERPNRAYKRFEETSLVDESKVMGREGDKEALLEKLLEKEACNQNVSIVSIVGLGGIGKTTLARILYNEEKVKDHFELRAWACVSEEFDVFSISKAIFQAIDGKSQEFANLDLLHVALKEKLSKKRFLVVLDDVWNENHKEWELLQRPFVEGAPGSKIIVTTRKTKVASVMKSSQSYDLDVLSEERALSLFARYALDEENFDKHPSLKLHGEGIVKKCGRLPLALITLGRVLRTKTNDDDWEELLNSEIWSLQDESEILPALRLSYNDLPSHLKQLFAYCSLFPKDYEFDKNELVLLWMAEGFLNQSNGRKSKESLGRDYFEELKSRSFFQASTNYDQSRYIMHDLINDLATSVAGEFFFRLDDKMDMYHVNGCFEKFRHVSFIGQEYGNYRKFKELQRARGLRTFLPIALNSWSSFNLSNSVLAELLPKLRFIRVLSLSHHSITQVPQSIGSLKHIRYLNFSETSIEQLPELVCDLYNLQSLLLRNCEKLSSLPVSFVKLINLRHLDISDTPMLKKMPLGIGGLTSLRTLSKVIIKGGNGFKIFELKGLLDLEGRLSIVGLDKVTSPTQAHDAKLQKKKGLDDLVLEWSDDFDDSRNHMIEYKVLEGLRPHHKLKRLEILFYGGMEFPSWAESPMFDRLTELRLRGCIRCTRLPSLGHLRSLKKLFVEGMDGVKSLGFELLGPTDSLHGIAFPFLEVLEFCKMQGLERWSTRLSNNVGISRSFPCLREVFISDCPKLVEISIDLIPSLQVLDIEGCSEEVFKSMVYASSSIGTLRLKNIKGLHQLNGKVLELLEAVEDLSISKCDELRYLSESKLEACKFLVNVRRLEIRDCKKLVSLGISMERVRKVNIIKCGSMKSYNCPNSVESLAILYCHSLTSLTFSTMHGLPSSLKTLRVTDCDNLESISDKGFGFKPLESLWISDCKNLKLFPYEHLESLTSLQDLHIYQCPSMDYSFPCGLWPPNLRKLRIGGLNKPMSEWGIQNYPTSLVHLQLYGNNPGVVSFVANAKDVTSSTFLVPPSLTFLQITNFVDAESVSEVLQHLPRLEDLQIWSCPKVKDLPKTTDPSSSRIRVFDQMGRPITWWVQLHLQIKQVLLYKENLEASRKNVIQKEGDPTNQSQVKEAAASSFEAEATQKAATIVEVAANQTKAIRYAIGTAPVPLPVPAETPPRVTGRVTGTGANVNDLDREVDFFKQHWDARGVKGFSPLQKCASAIRQLAYGSASDAFDEYLRMSETTSRDCLDHFCKGIIYLYMRQYLRKPTATDVQAIYALHEQTHGLPGMLGSIDCMHWYWNNCPMAWRGQFHRGDHPGPSVILEAVASQD